MCKIVPSEFWHTGTFVGTFLHIWLADFHETVGGMFVGTFGRFGNLLFDWPTFMKRWEEHARTFGRFGNLLFDWSKNA